MNEAAQTKLKKKKKGLSGSAKKHQLGVINDYHLLKFAFFSKKISKPRRTFTRPSELVQFSLPAVVVFILDC